MNEVKQLLQTPLDAQNPTVLANQLVTAEAYQSRVSEAYRAAEEDLATKRNKYYDPSRPTVLEREIALEAMVAPEERKTNELKDLAEILQRRISLGQSLLSNFRQELKSGIR